MSRSAILLLDDATAAPPAPHGLVSALDVSSAQGLDIGWLIDQYTPDVVIPKAYQNIELGGNGARYTIAQAKAARGRGLSVLFYFWIYGSLPGAQQAASALDTIRQTGINPPIIFADLELYTDNTSPGPTIIRSAIAEVERQGFKAGIYTGNWWIKGYYPGGEAAFSAEYGRYPLWLSAYDGVLTLDSVRLPTGWPRETLVGKQWSGSPIDRSVFRRDVCGL